MKAYTVKNNIIDNIIVYKDGASLPTGVFEAKNNESIGWVKSSSGLFKAPAKKIEPAKTKDQLIDQLESSITNRNLRSAILGDKYSIDKIKEVESQIIKLKVRS